MAKTPRSWTGARTPSGLKRVRNAERRHAILGPRRTAAKTLVKAALTVATTPTDGQDPQVALAEAMSALDRAAKVGAIHPNAAARRKSRLAIKVNAAIAGTGLAVSSHVAKTVGKAAAQKAAKARIAAGKADKAKGAQTAAGKARAALSKSTRAEAAAAVAAAKAAPAKAATKKAVAPKADKLAAKTAATKPAAKAAATKTAAKPAAKAAPAKATEKKAAAPKAAKAEKSAAKPAAKAASKTTKKA